MAITFRVAGTTVSNVTNPNPSTGAGLIASDLSVLWVTAKPAAGKTPADVVITTPATWIKLGQWASGSAISLTPPASGPSVLIAAYVKVGAAASTAIGALALTNVVVAGAFINTYATSLTNGWDYSAVTFGTDENGGTLSVTGAANLGLASGSWFLSGWAHMTNGVLTTPGVTNAGATLTTTSRTNSGGSAGSGNHGFGQLDSNVTAGTSSAAPVFTSASTVDGVVAFVRIKDASVAISSTDTVTVTDHVSAIPAARTWQNGQIVAAADLNYQIRDSFNWLLGNTRPALHLRSVATQPYALAAETKLVYDTADTQVGDIWWWSGVPQIMVGEPGVYTGQITLNANVPSGTNNWNLVGKLYVFRAGVNVETVVIQAPDLAAVPEAFVIGGLPFSVYLRAGDYVELRVSGGWSLAVNSASGAPDVYLSIDLWWLTKWEG